MPGLRPRLTGQGSRPVQLPGCFCCPGGVSGEAEASRNVDQLFASGDMDSLGAARPSGVSPGAGLWSRGLWAGGPWWTSRQARVQAMAGSMDTALLCWVHGPLSVPAPSGLPAPLPLPT